MPTVAFTDNFQRADAASLGSGWDDPGAVASIASGGCVVAGNEPFLPGKVVSRTNQFEGAYSDGQVRAIVSAVATGGGYATPGLWLHYGGGDYSSGWRANLESNSGATQLRLSLVAYSGRNITTATPLSTPLSGPSVEVVIWLTTHGNDITAKVATLADPHTILATATLNSTNAPLGSPAISASDEGIPNRFAEVAAWGDITSADPVAYPSTNGTADPDGSSGGGLTLSDADIDKIAARVRIVMADAPVGSVAGKVAATLDASDVTGNIPANLKQVAGQTASAPVSGGVAFPGSIGTSTFAGGVVAGVSGPVGSVINPVVLPTIPPVGYASAITLNGMATQLGGIRARTDALPVTWPANFGSLAVSASTGGVSIDLNQTGLVFRDLGNVPDAELTVGDGIVSSIAGAAGKQVVSGTNYIIKTPFTGTVIRSFTLNSATAPTSRI